MINWKMEVAMAYFTTPHLFHRPLESDKNMSFLRIEHGIKREFKALIHRFISPIIIALALEDICSHE